MLQSLTATSSMKIVLMLLNDHGSVFGVSVVWVAVDVHDSRDTTMNP